MIIDITSKFYEETGSSRSVHTQSNWHASLFIKTSTSYLADLTTLQTKINDLQKSIKSSSRFEKDAHNKRILNVKQHLKLCEQNIKRLKSTSVDIKSKKQMAQKLKQSILITMELKLLKATFRFKDIHLSYARKNAKESPSLGSERQINLSKSHFLQQSQEQVLQQNAVREYKQIEKSIHEISQMYKETVSVVRLQELLVDNIQGYIDQTDENVNSGKKNLSQLNNKEQQNRKFIVKVFTILYAIVFIYLVFLS